jgi:hypothetical protein
LEGLALEDVGLFCGRLVHFMFIWYIFPVLVCCTKKNLAALAGSDIILILPLVKLDFMT